MKLSTATSTFLAHHKMTASDNTVRVMAAATRMLEREIGPNVDVRDINRPLLEDLFLANERVTGYAPNTYNNYRDITRRMFEWLHSRGHCTQESAVTLREIRSQKPVKRQHVRLSARQLLATLDGAASPRDRIALALLMNTGCRQSELCGLRVGDVNLQRGVIKVWVSKTRVEDYMPISSDLDVELRRWLLAYQQECGKLKAECYLIPQVIYKAGRRGSGGPGAYAYGPGTPMHRLDDIVKGALERVGVDGYRTGSHTIRRSVARAYFDSLADGGHDHALNEVASMLHHSSTTVTQHYIGADLGREKRDATLKGRPFLTSMVENVNVASITQDRGIV